jgi:hypothetical protein
MVRLALFQFLLAMGRAFILPCKPANGKWLMFSIGFADTGYGNWFLPWCCS